MAGPFQIGDLVAFGKIAWTVYQYGWAEELSASKQYNDFGRDVRSLAESLDNLTRVIYNANTSLNQNNPALYRPQYQSQQHGAFNTMVRWHPSSLRQIIGDYEMTLRECYELVQTNNRHRIGSSPFRNVEWNVVVQPKVEVLRQRIALHNTKILHFLKPFEIDLLCRVRQDIQAMHQDLSSQIAALRRDILGVLVPNLDRELDQQAQREIHLLEVPTSIADRFQFAALRDRPHHDSDASFELDDLSDAFILNYNRSTIAFRGGLMVDQRMPSLEQYLNLLKCVWLFRRIKDNASLVDCSPESHWPSYVSQLEEDLSGQCGRFVQQELVQPELALPSLSGDLFSIWPEEEPEQLVPVVTQDELMDQILKVPLESSVHNVERSMVLLRRQKCEGRRFRIMITGTEQSRSGRPRRQTEVIDFDISSVMLSPQYALPSGNMLVREMILQRDERIARLSFTRYSDILKFQNALTGYKVWASHTQSRARVTFVVSGQKEVLVEEACLQLWIPKSVAGSPVTNAEMEDAKDEDTMRRSSTHGSSSTNTGMSIPHLNGRVQTIDTMASDWQSDSPDSVYGNNMNQRSRIQPLYSGSPPPARYGMSAPLDPGVWQSPGLSPGFLSPRAMSSSFASGSNGLTQRSLSVSSAVSHVTSDPSNSSSSNGHTTIVSTGEGTTGTIHRRPSKPLLVIFTQSRVSGRLSFVTVQIDENTLVNPERCHCRRRDGAFCTVAAIEQLKGKEDLQARRYEMSSSSDRMVDWNIARLAINNPASTGPEARWDKVKRVTIDFPQPTDRAIFSGTPNDCRCRTRNPTEAELENCIKMGHKGLWGEVQEEYRRRCHEYHQSKFGKQHQVVYGPMS